MATSFSFGGRSGVPGENHRPRASNWETLSLAAAYKAKKDETELSDMTGRHIRYVNLICIVSFLLEYISQLQGVLVASW